MLNISRITSNQQLFTDLNPKEAEAINGGNNHSVISVITVGVKGHQECRERNVIEKAEARGLSVEERSNGELIFLGASIVDGTFSRKKGCNEIEGCDCRASADVSLEWLRV